MKVKNGIDPEVEKQLGRLKAVPARDSQAAARGRARFLAEAAVLQPKPKQKVHAVTSRRLAWRFVLAALAAVVLIFGGGVGAAFAAQDALPGEALYPIKIMSEDVRLELASDPQAGINLLMQFASVRVSEMNQLVVQESDIPVQTAERLENQIQMAFQLAAGLDDDGMQAALLGIRTKLEEQAQTLLQGSGETGDLLQQTRLMLQEHLRQADEGLADPEAFRAQMRYGQGDAILPAVPSATSVPTGQGGSSTPGGPDQTPGPQQTPEKTPAPSKSSGTPSTPGDGGGGGGGGDHP